MRTINVRGMVVMKESYIVSNDYVNAWSILKGLRLFGINKRDIYIYQQNKVSLCSGMGLRLNNIKNKFLEKDHLFFTEEDNLEFHLQNSPAAIFYPKNINSEIIFDKLKFAELLDSINEIPVPYISDLDLDNYEKSGMVLPAIIKSRFSWKNKIKLPRGFIINKKVDLKTFLLEIEKIGWSKSDFYLQKYISNNALHNLSTSGWHSEEDNYYIVTRKIMQDTVPIGNGIIIEQINDPENLEDRTKIILDHLSYVGPFELEFMYDPGVDKYYVLELNPRFWMQNYIFVDHYNNIITKKYLNSNIKKERKMLANKKVLWINSIHLLRSIRNSNFTSLVTIKKYSSEINKYSIAPDFKTAIKYLIKNKLKNT